MMTESKKPNFKKANTLANEILVASSTIISFPVNAKRIIKEWTDIKVLSFKCAHEYDIDIEAFGSESSVLLCKDGMYIVFYDQNKNVPHIKYSILHEFGHYRFGHKLGNYTEADEEYGHMEVEANCFAAQLLMPEQVLIELEKRGAIISESFLVNNFGVSITAAKKRINTRGKYNYSWRSEEEKMFDDIILYKYEEFINSIAPKKNKYTEYHDEDERQKERDRWMYEDRARY